MLLWCFYMLTTDKVRSYFQYHCILLYVDTFGQRWTCFPTDINIKNNKALTLLNLFIPSLWREFVQEINNDSKHFMWLWNAFRRPSKSLSTLQNFEIFEVLSLIFSRHIGPANEGVAMKNWELGCMKPLVMLIWEIPFEKPIRNQFNFLLKVKKINEYIKCIDSKNKGAMPLSSTLFYLLDYWYHIKNFQKHR